MPSTTTPPPSNPSQKPKQRNRSGPRTKNGSYRHYYSRRHDGVHPDDRLPLLRQVCKSYQKSFTLLDIGCNDGTLTTELASLTSCTRAIGLDINPNLIGDARKKLRALVDNRSRGPAALQGPLPRACESLPLGVRQALQLGKEPRIRNGVMDNPLSTNVDGEDSFPGNVVFRTEDFACPEDPRTSREVAQYDIVLCLSVTKWVHFAWGDRGLERMFRRIYQCLKPGGILILEPQPMKSYKSAIRKGLGKKDFNGERKLRPHEFAHYLKFHIGFTDMKVLRKTRERGHAFNRPIMAFVKDSLWTLSLTSRGPFFVFAEDGDAALANIDAAVAHINNAHQHVFPVGLDVVEPGNGLLLAEPAPPNMVPANLAPAPLANLAPAPLGNPTPAPLGNPTPAPTANPTPASPANSVPANPAAANPAPANSAPASPAPVSTGPGNAAPSTETQALNGKEEDSQNEQTDNDRGNAGWRIESSIVVQQEDTIRGSHQAVNPEVSASPLNETEQHVGEAARDANIDAANGGEVVPRTSGCKRRRSEEDTEASDERSAKVVKHDSEAAKQ